MTTQCEKLAIASDSCSPAIDSVSVVIPAYNCGSEIQAALESALDQVGVNVRVIIVDDGSTDDTLSFLNALQLQYPHQVEILSQQNSGPAAARNAGIWAATGDWIAFLDHDDVWHQDKLKQQLELARSAQSDVVVTGTRNLGAAERVAEFRDLPNLDGNPDVFRLLLNENFVTISSAIVRRSKLLEVGGFKTQWRGVEDWALWLQLASSGCKFSALDSALVDYQWSDHSLSRQNEAMQKQRRRLVCEMLQTDAGKAISFANRRKVLAEERNCSAWAMAPSSFSRAAWFYSQSLMAWPFNLTAAKGLLKCILRRS